MMAWIDSLPLLPAVAFLYVVILARAGGTYALGRGAHRLADRGRMARFLREERVSRAIGVVHRWGAPVVAVSFLTVGFQTAVNAAAGLTRMPLRRYLPALAIGGLAWAVIYATVGLAAVMLWLELFLRSPWAALLLLALILLGVLLALRLRRRRRDAATAEAERVPGAAGARSADQDEGASIAPPKRRSRRA
ncbi:DedA family protein [Brachybacterium hainanense]|uniref:DedA family protein n=1 Tax=Brachybacterium hainanense TaxID=1541174 RepID=A0ABV6RE51_9MICO